MTLLEIVALYLRQNGYDGLFNESECACKIDDLAPCGEPGMACRAGYLAPCLKDCGVHHQFHIQGQKPGAKKS